MENNTTDVLSPADYWDQLNRHDWFYAMSDDHSAWKAGKADFERLQHLSYTSDDHRVLFLGFTKNVKARILGDDVVPALPTRPEES